MSEALRRGPPGFDEGLGATIRAMRCMRPPTDDEVDRSYEVWRTADAERLCAVWREVASPHRAIVPFPASFFYPRLGVLPRRINGMSFLITVRAALAAGVRFRASLRPVAAEVLATRFPWLEQRHLHIPEGHTPHVDFPDVFRAFIDVDDPDEVAARWQLAACANEVQQAAYTRWTARAYRLPELLRHAEREEALAANYMGHWTPACDRELWRQTLWVLDALNAALFAWVVDEATAALMARSAWGALSDEWDRFVAALDEPPPLVPIPPGRTAWRRDL